MWFGLLPGPFTVIRAFTPRPKRRTRRRSCARRPSNDLNLSFRAQLLWGSIGLGMFGWLFLGLSANGVQPGQIPPGISAPYGWYTDNDGYLERVTGVNVPPVLYPKAKDTSPALGITMLIASGAGLLLTIATWRWLGDGSSPPHSPLPPASPPWLPQPAPLPEPDLVQTRSGHKPLNRELPMDRPHPWRTWEG